MLWTTQRRLTNSEFADIICELWNAEITKKLTSHLKPREYLCCRDKYPTRHLNDIKLKKYNEGAESFIRWTSKKEMNKWPKWQNIRKISERQDINKINKKYQQKILSEFFQVHPLLLKIFYSIKLLKAFLQLNVCVK